MSLENFDFKMATKNTGVTFASKSDEKILARVYGMCGAGINCGGGGGTCGAAVNCAGGGGMCGAGINCAGQ